MNRTVRVRAPCRLHFGMFSFGRPDVPQYGGVGIMIEPPCVEVAFTPADHFSTGGAHEGRVRQLITLLGETITGETWSLAETPRCAVHVDAPPDHIGLGVGTQLGLAIATGIRRLLNLPPLAIEELATSIGRARRSAVGTFGFQLGGMIVDRGVAGNSGARLERRLSLPPVWRIVLIRPLTERGLAGNREQQAFARLHPIPDSVTAELWRITYDQMLPSLEAADCSRFGEAVFHFGRLAGECFAEIQGGPFASPRIAKLVTTLRELGVAGAGQSSWGPTVFAILPCENDAHRLTEQLRSACLAEDCEISVAAPNNSGALISDSGDANQPLC